jgi:hypothetical protein
MLYCSCVLIRRAPSEGGRERVRERVQVLAVAFQHDGQGFMPPMQAPVGGANCWVNSLWFRKVCFFAIWF